MNAGRDQPYDWAGNEPGEWVPFAYDYAGAPWRTQSVVRRIMTQLYPLAPAGEPGEDDLGALSSWYVWAALGLYPETPGAADLAMAGPLFPRAVVHEGNGRTLTVVGAHAPDVYVQGARLSVGSGRAATRHAPWIPAVAVADGATLTVDLGTSPDPAWGSRASDAPPSHTTGAAPAVAFTTPGGSVSVPVGGSAAVGLGVQEVDGASGTAPTATVSWHVVGAGTVPVVTPASGTLRVSGGRATTPLEVTATGPGTRPVTIALRQGGRALPDLTLDVVAAP